MWSNWGNVMWWVGVEWMVGDKKQNQGTSLLANLILEWAVKSRRHYSSWSWEKLWSYNEGSNGMEQIFLDVYNKTVWIVQQSVIQSPDGKFQVKQVPIGLPRCTVTRKIGRHCIDRENTLLVIMVTLGTEVQMLGGLANVGTKKSIFRMLWYLSSAFST